MQDKIKLVKSKGLNEIRQKRIVKTKQKKLELK